MDNDVIDRDGVRGTVVGRSRSDGGAEWVTIAVGEHRYLVPAGTLQQRQQDHYLPFRFTEFETTSADEPVTVPVIEEQLHVETRPHEERVRVEKQVHTRDEAVELPMTEEDISIERVALNREVEQPFEAHYDGDTLIIPLFEEVLVTQKRLVLREEIRITKRRVERSAHDNVRLRSEQATVTRENASPT